jgi:predicted DNA-binding antitoxin AbrB/MazE fold protein
VKRHIHVVFENGVLRPLEPVDFAERQELVMTVSEEEVPLNPKFDVSAELRWLKENGSQFLDQWVALDGDRLVSHGRNAKAVYDEARAAGFMCPYLTQVTAPDEHPWGGW